jgi:adenylate cyclase
MEKGKRIVPVLLEEVTVPEPFQYPLAGLQRVPISDTDAIIKALAHTSPIDPYSAHQRSQHDKRRKDVLRKRAYIGGAVVFALLVAYNIFFHESSKQQGIPVIGVLPFVNETGDTNGNYFAIGISREIAEGLEELSEVRVINSDHVRDFTNASMTIPAIGAELKADYLISGSTERKDADFRISVHVVRASDGKNIWSQSYIGAGKQIFEVQKEIREKIVEAIKVTLSSKSKALTAHGGTTNPDAYDYFLKGQQFYRLYYTDAVETSIDLFRKAIAIDPNYADAHADLAKAYSTRAFYSNDSLVRATGIDSAFQSALKAILLDDRCAAAYDVLVRNYGLQHKFADGLEAGKKLLSVGPSTSRYYYTLACLYNYCDTLPEIAAQYLEKSIALDSMQLWAYLTLRDVYAKIPGREADTSRIDKPAAKFFGKYVSKNPDAGRQRLWLGFFQLRSGDTIGALASLRQIAQSEHLDRFSPEHVAGLLYEAGDIRTSEALKKRVRDEQNSRN